MPDTNTCVCWHNACCAGGVPGAEPLPFMGLPLLEPELHPSYVLRSVVLTSATSNQYAATEVCTRGALGEAVGKETSKSS